MTRTKLVITVLLLAVLAAVLSVAVPRSAAAFQQGSTSAPASGTAAGRVRHQATTTDVTPSSISAGAPAGVFVVDVRDVSGTMRRFAAEVRAAEKAQLKFLSPGDLFARIDFDSGPARVKSLVLIREPGDVARLLDVDDTPSTGEKTELARGLEKSRELVEEQANGRRVVQIVSTDGVEDPTDGAEPEKARLDATAAWWRGRRDAVTVLVAPDDAVRQSKPFQAFASAIDAKVVSLSEFAAQSVVVREVRAMRTAPEPAPATPQPRRDLLPASWIAAASCALLLFVGALVLRRRGRTRHDDAARLVAPDTVPVPTAAVRVTVRGETRDVAVPLTEAQLEAGVSLGSPGETVELPGFRGAPIKIALASGEREIVMPAGVTAWVGADRVPAAGGRYPFHDHTSFMVRDAYVSLDLRMKEASK